MPYRIAIERPMNKNAQHLERVRARINASLEILRLSCPDTFLGRRTQDPVLSKTRMAVDTETQVPSRVAGCPIGRAGKRSTSWRLLNVVLELLSGSANRLAGTAKHDVDEPAIQKYRAATRRRQAAGACVQARSALALYGWWNRRPSHQNIGKEDNRGRRVRARSLDRGQAAR